MMVTALPAQDPVSTTTPAVDDELAADLRLAVGRLSRRLRQHAVGGLSPSQVSAMASLDCHGPVVMGRLSRLEGVSAPTMTRIIDRLELQGLVSRRVDPGDARSAVVQLTAEGTAALTRLRHERTAFLAERLCELDDDEVAALTAALPALRRLADDGQGPSGPLSGIPAGPSGPLSGIPAGPSGPLSGIPAGPSGPLSGIPEGR